MRGGPVPFAHPTFRNLRPQSDPEAQVAAATELREALLFEGCTSVTTQLPKRGGAAVLVGWVKDETGRHAVAGPFQITEGGEVFSL